MKNFTYSKLTLLLFLVLPFTVFSQVSEGGTPLSWTNSSIPELNEKEIMNTVDVNSLKAEDEIESQYKDIPMRFAYGHDVNYTTDNSGEWFVLPNGDKIWRLRVHSKKALSINVTFSKYNLPEGAKLFIYSYDKQYSIGAFTSFNNKESGYLGTSPVLGDDIVIEYFEPSDVDFEGELEIETIAHAYRDIFKIANAVSKDKDFGDAGSCNNNVVCEEAEDWEAQVRSVALITLSNGTRLCTGSLLNNVSEDETPYFLTANHCVGGGSVTTWVFIFNYYSDICDAGGSGNDGSTLESVSGASLLANTNSVGGSTSIDSMQTDMALLLLAENVPDSFNVFYNGWDWSGIAPTSSVGIHHPSGDVKKISWDEDEAGITGYFDLTTTGNGGGTTHWRIFDWEDGTTEGGSSGSPLFNESKQVIGQLHGGQASCFNNVNDYYGRLALSFTYIQQWLDPDSTGVTNINGFPFPVILGTDPGLQSIQGIDDSYCDVNSISPTVRLKNYGTSEITELDIDYYLDGNLEGTYNWTGSLQNGDSESIDIGAIDVLESGTHIFSAEFDYDGDENVENNQSDFEFYSIIGGATLDISILTDNWGSETTWAIYSMDGIDLASGGPYGPDFNPTLFEISACIPDTCVEFVIFDSAGDGICCAYGEGSYSVTYNGVEVASGGEFDSQESTIVCPNIIDAIEDVNPFQEFSIYPNPASDKLFIDLNQISLNEVEIRFSNLIGQTISMERLNNVNSKIELDIQDFPRGIYVVAISNSDFSRSFKVVLE